MNIIWTKIYLSNISIFTMLL